uniref:Uncharacterized protein n=1 Tax=Anguilla anguilla TaxID=7936 RepID=A0A0E9S6Q8_ANGAN
MVIVTIFKMKKKSYSQPPLSFRCPKYYPDVAQTLSTHCTNAGEALGQYQGRSQPVR